MREDREPTIYNLVYTHRACKDITKLPPEVVLRVKKGLERLRTDPLSISTKLVDESLGQYRCRVGHYRVVFDVRGRDIVVLRVGHRREIYRK